MIPSPMKKPGPTARFSQGKQRHSAWARVCHTVVHGPHCTAAVHDPPMKTLVCMLLLATPAAVELLDETPTIAAGKWNYYAVNLRQQPARVDASFEVRSATGEV